jgi:dihydroflavonol-4-reductase
MARFLETDYWSFISLLKRLMDGMPGCPRSYFGVVDVRDVADLHLRAMTHAAAKGECLIAVGGECPIDDRDSRMVKSRMGGLTRGDPALRKPLPILERSRNVSNES